MELLSEIVNPTFLAMIAAAIFAFATVLTLAVPALSKDRSSSRMKIMALERDKMRAHRVAELAAQKSGGAAAKLRTAPKGTMSNIVDQLNLRKAFETEEVKNRLKMAGLRGQAPVVAFVFFRFAMPIVSFFASLFYFFVVNDFGYPPVVRVGAAFVCGFLGMYLPNVFIQNMISKRQQSINSAFPDALDLLLICVQAGMSTEAAFGKVAKEVTSQSLELGEEFHLTTAELSYLGDRKIAFDNLAKRTGIPAVKATATALIQAERYGTPVGQALRVMAKENREMRMAAAEKKAAQLPPKLTVPMIVFFLPVLFLVILGPAYIQYTRLDKDPG
jgi:tight adherence protein C